MAAYLYFGEASGARIHRYGTGYTQATTSSTEPVLLSGQTWDMIPAGEVGDCVFRSVDVTVRATNGYLLDVTPVVDGTDQPTQRFSGSGAGVFSAQAFIATRGNRVSAKLAQVTRAGDLEIQDVQASFKVIRTSP